jgi:IS30 family transposase
MSRKRNLQYTDELKKQIWDQYKQGQSLWSIARSIDRTSSSIYSILVPSGGIRPPERSRSKHALTLAEREEISRGIVAQESMRSIAARLNRYPSTISREINRNSGLDKYRASRADQQAWNRALRPKTCRLVSNPALAKLVEVKLRRKWSPQQIAGWLKREYPSDESNQVSHETIYRSLFIQSRGALKKELQLYLRSQRTIRRSKPATAKRRGQGRIPNALSIRERPASVEDRAIPGHWEGDLIVGSNNSYIATLVERQSRYVMMAKLENKKADTLVAALIKQTRKLPSELYKSLTWDRGTEMTGHERFTLATDIKVYFCDPRCPWQRGTNENTNRLLRDYLPKGTNISAHSQKELDWIARELNERPRKTLEYETPADKFDACVAATG